MNKKFWCTLIILLIWFTIKTPVYASSLDKEMLNDTQKSFGISDFLEETKKYTGDFFEDINIDDMLNSAIAGKIDNSKIFKKILNLFGKELVSSMKTLVGILVIVLVHSILKAISEGLENDNISRIIYYAQYILIITLIMNNFSSIISNINDTINNLVGFTNCLIPLLTTLMVYTGSITSSSLLEPIILFVINFIGNIIGALVLPVVSIIVALIIVSRISDKIQIVRLASFMKSSIGWFLGVILTIFVGVISLEGTLTSSVDGITAKTAKAAISSLIPVVGKVLGDSVDSVLGCGVVLKNAVGVVGVIIIIGICIAPIIKLTTLSILYSISSAIIEPIADEKIVRLLGEFSSIFKLLLGILCSVSILFVIGITLVIKISNSGMMYR